MSALYLLKTAEEKKHIDKIKDKFNKLDKDTQRAFLSSAAQAAIGELPYGWALNRLYGAAEGGMRDGKHYVSGFFWGASGVNAGEAKDKDKSLLLPTLAGSGVAGTTVGLGKALLTPAEKLKKRELERLNVLKNMYEDLSLKVDYRASDFYDKLADNVSKQMKEISKMDPKTFKMKQIMSVPLRTGAASAAIGGTLYLGGRLFSRKRKKDKK